jgi:hypothetical protein
LARNIKLDLRGLVVGFKDLSRDQIPSYFAIAIDVEFMPIAKDAGGI